jgi:hypothetical protein
MKKPAITLYMLMIFSTAIFSQNEIDALRYSTTSMGGTARSLSMGGAFGSLGGDFSSIGINPAGMGLYKKSEFTITPSFYVGSTKSKYNGLSTSDSEYNFNLSNVGFVMNTKTKNSLVKNFQFSFGLIRTNNFNNRVLIEGVNSENSIMSAYADDATGIDPEILDNGDYPFDLSQAWWTYMINPKPDCDDFCYSDTIPAGTPLLQSKEINTWGSMNEYTFGLSASFGDRLYLGTSVGLPTIRYFQESFYTEVNQNLNVTDFRKLNIYEELITKGTGVNVKLGMILRVTNFIRIGGAFHSPTWFNNMNDSWFSSHATEFVGNSFYENSPYGNFNYELQTPWKAMGSASVVLWRAALISIDYEYIDYTTAKLKSREYRFTDENRNIREVYTQTHNVKLGSEVRLGLFALRAGFGYNMSPYADDINDGEKFSYSAGFGFREKNFFVDMGYVRTASKQDYYLYGTQNVQVNPSENKYYTNNLLLTLGFRY